MAQVVDGRATDRVGAAPSSVSMAVLCVVMPALTPALSWTGLIGGASPGGLLLPFALVIGLPLLVGASALLTAVYILPTVALGHWLGRLAGHGRKWWYALAGTAVGLLPVVGLPAVARMSQSGIHEWGRLAADGLLVAAALWLASAPASIAVHVTVLREEAGRPVRPVGGILLWGTLGLTVEGTAWVMCL